MLDTSMCSPCAAVKQSAHAQKPAQRVQKPSHRVQRLRGRMCKKLVFSCTCAQKSRDKNQHFLSPTRVRVLGAD